MKQKLILIAGSPCVVKSAVGDRLLESYDNCAFFDGDWAWCIHPFSVKDPRLRRGDKIMSFALSTHLDSGFDYVIFPSVVIIGAEIRRRILEDIVTEREFITIPFTLKCSEETLQKRYEKRGGTGKVDLQWLKAEPLPGDFAIDTDGKSIDQVAAEMRGIIDGI